MIRGISDYAGAHKGGDWKHWAAANAAACAKEILLLVRPEEVDTPQAGGLRAENIRQGNAGATN